jgi:hypothetical protein
MYIFYINMHMKQFSTISVSSLPFLGFLYDFWDVSGILVFLRMSGSAPTAGTSKCRSGLSSLHTVCHLSQYGSGLG